MTHYPLIRSATFILSDFLKSGPKDPDGFAGQQAKRMMGGGSSALDREAGSVWCGTCSRWHRGGSACPSLGKGLQNSMLRYVSLRKGERPIVSHPEGGGGNSYHDPSTGQFTNAPKSGSAHSEVAIERLKRVASEATGDESAANEFAKEEPTRSTPRDDIDQQLAERERQRGGSVPPGSLVGSGEYEHRPVKYTGMADSDFARETPTTSLPREQVDAYLAANPPAAPQAAPAPMPPPQAIQGLHTLLSMKQEPRQQTDPGQKLMDQSGHLQNQHTGYLNSLRDWQSRYAGA